MENTGWIKLHRKITEWEWYDDHNTTRLFIHLLATVNHKDGEWRGRVVQCGQRVTTLRKLSDECGLSIKSLRTSINKLKRARAVAHEGHSDFSLLTVLNYTAYQKKGTQVDTRGANEGHIYKNNKNNKEEKKKEPIYIDDGELRPPTPKQTMEDFIFSIQNNTQDSKDLINKIAQNKKISPAEVKQQLDRFVNYWTELNSSGTKQRWQLEKVFEVRRRLATWFSRIQSDRGGFKKDGKVVFIS